MDVLALWIWPLSAALVTTVCTVLLARQYRERRKAHQLAWAIGFAMWAASAYMEFAAILLGYWPDLLYRFYIVTTAALVPVLGYGTIRLMAKRPIWGQLYIAINLALVAVFAYGVFTHPMLSSELAKANVASYAALGPKGTYPRLLSAFISIPGALVLWYGAVHSIFLFIRKKEYAYRVWANVLIATATFVIAAAGGLAATGKPQLFYIAELAAAGLYLWGFLLASSLKKGAEAAKANRRRGEADATSTQ